jgi:hypothetical protein
MMISETICHGQNPDDSSSLQIETILEELLRDPTRVDWNEVYFLFRELPVAAHVRASGDSTFTSTKDDDALGRSLLSILLSRNPPINVLDAMLQVFPDSLRLNSDAFFTACRFTTAQTITQMMNHSLLRTTTGGACMKQECPYPWILSNHVSVEGANAMIQAYPQGILQSSSFLSSLCPLDFFLMSPEIIKKRNFDKNIWTKFKLMLVAAECHEEHNNHEKQNSGLSPVHVILERILSRPGMY